MYYQNSPDLEQMLDSASANHGHFFDLLDEYNKGDTRDYSTEIGNIEKSLAKLPKMVEPGNDYKKQMYNLKVERKKMELAGEKIRLEHEASLSENSRAGIQNIIRQYIVLNQDISNLCLTVLNSTKNNAEIKVSSRNYHTLNHIMKYYRTGKPVSVEIPREAHQTVYEPQSLRVIRTINRNNQDSINAAQDYMSASKPKKRFRKWFAGKLKKWYQKLEPARVQPATENPVHSYKVPDQSISNDVYRFMDFREKFVQDSPLDVGKRLYNGWNTRVNDDSRIIHFAAGRGRDLSGVYHTPNQMQHELMKRYCLQPIRSLDNLAKDLASRYNVPVNRLNVSDYVSSQFADHGSWKLAA